jgi:LuxR family maltose regulon positive regulatory protein
VLARTLIAQERLDDAIRLLQWLFDQAQTRGRTSKTIEILLLQALAYQAGGDTNQAMDVLERALNLAEPAGFVRIFTDEGPPMAPLLYEALDRGIEPNYVNRFLQAFPIDEPQQVEPSVSQFSESVYIEPLSEREIEVLQLVAEGLTNSEIAARLILSTYTVKTHTRNIYGKLGVNNRTQAVTKARTLGILSAT